MQVPFRHTRLVSGFDCCSFVKIQALLVEIFIVPNHSFVKEIPPSKMIKLKVKSNAAVVFFIIILFFNDEYMGKKCRNSVKKEFNFYAGLRSLSWFCVFSNFTFNFMNLPFLFLLR